MCEGNEGLIPQNRLKITKCPKFGGKLSHKEAENKLKAFPEGACIVYKIDNQSNYNICVRNGSIVSNFKILRTSTDKFMVFSNRSYDSINDVIDELCQEDIHNGQIYQKL